MRIMKLDTNGVVLNVAIADEELEGWVEAPSGVGPGWTINEGGENTPPEPSEDQ